MAKLGRWGFALLSTPYNKNHPTALRTAALWKETLQIRALSADDKGVPADPTQDNETEKRGDADKNDSQTNPVDRQSMDGIFALKRTTRRSNVTSPTDRLSRMIPETYWQAQSHTNPSPNVTSYNPSDTNGQQTSQQRTHEPSEEQSLAKSMGTFDEPTSNNVGDSRGPTQRNVAGAWRRPRRSLSPALRISHLLPDSFWESQTEDKVEAIKSAGPLADMSPASNIMDPSEERDKFVHSSLDVLPKRAHVIASDPAQSLHGYLTALTRTKKPTYVPSPKVVQTLIDHLDIQPGSTVLEAGSGAGVSTLLLSRIVGKCGRLFSVERDLKSHELCRQRWMDWHQECQDRGSENGAVDNVFFIHGRVEDVCGRLAIHNMLDAVYLDVPDVSSALSCVLPAVKSGGVIGIYTPSVSRMTSLLRTASDQELPVVLEGVWESVDKEWHVHQGDGDHQVSHPVTHENDTSFLVKFRKIEGAARDATRENLQGNSFENEDNILLTSLHQTKKRLHRKVLLRLESGAEFYNHLGKLKHDDIIDRACGSILQTSTDRSVYVTRATGYEKLALSHDIKLDYIKAVSHACFLSGVSQGDRVLGVSQKPASLHTIIKTITCDDGKLVSDRHPSGNYGTPCFKWATNPPQAYTWDAILISSLARNLSSSDIGGLVKNLKPYGRLAFISYNLMDTNAALGHISQVDDLRFVGLHELAGREWVLRLAQIPPSTKTSSDNLHQEDGGFGHYISRPKHGIKNRAAFITVSQKVSP